MTTASLRSVRGVRGVRRGFAAMGLLVWSSGAEATGQTKTLTYTEHVSAIIDAHCVSCHRPGGIGPFGLDSYEAVRDRAERVAAVTAARAMPPWKPTAPVGVFQGERRLTQTQIDLIGRWAAEGAAEGPRVTRGPSRATDTSGWPLGEPDLVLSMEPYSVAPGAGDVYRKFVLPVPLTTMRWVRAIDIRPGSSHTVHHARIAIDTTRRARDLDAADPLPGYDGFMADAASFPGGHVLGWAPGKVPVSHPDSLSWPLAPGADFVLQLHLLPHADAVVVRPQIGLYFAQRPATRQPLPLVLNSTIIDIPPGVRSHVVRDTYRLPVPVDVLAVYPHAHYLARKVEAEAHLPDGQRRTLIRIDEWDYNWQDEYRFVTPVRLPAGTTLEMRYEYDNSSENPRNPHRPPKPVRFGPSATDEMAQLLLQVLTPAAADRALLAQDLRVKAGRDEIAGYQVRLARDPADHASHTGLAVRYLELGRASDAAAALGEAIRLAPTYADAHYNMGAAMLALHKPADAIAAYRRAIEFDPTYAEAHNNLGVLLETVGDRPTAIAHYRRAIQIQPHLADAHANLASALAADAKPEEAVRHYREALAGQPTHVEWRVRLARALRSIGRHVEAGAECDRALADDAHAVKALRDPNERTACTQGPDPSDASRRQRQHR